MAGDIHSIEFYQNIAKYKADKNQNGKIDDDEKDAYNNQMKQYDMNQDGKYDDTDVSLFKASVTLTDDDKANANALHEFVKVHGSNIYSWTKEELAEYNKLDKADPLNKRIKNIKFQQDAANTLKSMTKGLENETPENYQKWNDYVDSFIKFSNDNKLDK